MNTQHMVNVLMEVLGERERQEKKWGQQNWPDGTGGEGSKDAADNARALCDLAASEDRLTYRDILCEEFYEALAEADAEKLRKELVQVAAVASAWVEAIDRRLEREP